MKTSMWPRGLSRQKASAYLGISSTLFDQLVAKNQMPEPFTPSKGRILWDIVELDQAFENLPRKSQQQGNSWDG